MRVRHRRQLRWQVVDLEGGVLRVRATLKWSRRTGEWVFQEPKTRRSRRQVAISPYVVEVLLRHRARQNQERALLGAAWKDLDVVFCSQVGTPQSARIVVRWFVSLLEREGLPRVRFHDLRHTCATLLLSARVNPKVVSEMLGALDGEHHARYLLARDPRHAAGCRGGDGASAPTCRGRH